MAGYSYPYSGGSYDRDVTYSYGGPTYIPRPQPTRGPNADYVADSMINAARRVGGWGAGNEAADVWSLYALQQQYPLQLKAEMEENAARNQFARQIELEKMRQAHELALVRARERANLYNDLMARRYATYLRTGE